MAPSAGDRRRPSAVDAPLPAGAAIRAAERDDTAALTDLQNAAFAGSWGYAPNTTDEIAYRDRTVLEFDPKTETITNSKEANAMLTKEYREPFGLPNSV